jgi:MraZ protein
MFQIRGQFDVRMDAKGRLPLPARLREKLAEQADPRLVLTAWDGGLQGFTLARWTKMERRFAGVSLFDRKTRAFLLSYVAGAAEVETDGHGRILVPAPLRRRAGLSGDCVITSYLGLLEIWDAARWQQRLEQALADVELDGGTPDLSLFDPEDDLGDL